MTPVVYRSFQDLPGVSRTRQPIIFEWHARSEPRSHSGVVWGVIGDDMGVIEVSRVHLGSFAVVVVRGLLARCGTQPMVNANAR